METSPAPGENIALLRKSRGWGQARLARDMGVSLSYLSKIETGRRAVTASVAAAAARALRVTTARIYGQPFAEPSAQAEGLDSLRVAVRRYTLPREDLPEPSRLAAGLRHAAGLRSEARYLELLGVLPKLLGEATATAMESDGDAVAWGQVADAYGCAYAVAHRLGLPDLADMIVTRQTWAARQTWNPQAEAGAAWNEAGICQSAGEYADGLAIVERAIVQFERTRPRPEDRIVALGSLHLRGVVLASRQKDAAATGAHLRHAKEMAAHLPHDVLEHNLTFGTGNTALYELAAHVELGNPKDAVTMAAPLLKEPPAGLKPNRLGRLFIDVARARLDLKDLNGAEEALKEAYRVAPQMSEIHPMSRETLRVLFTLHQRTKPELLTMAKRSGLA